MATPTVVDTSVFSLAGGVSERRATTPAGFYDPVPLGVRIYNVYWALDVWITNIVEDVEFRSVAPGGFASATLKLRDDGSQSRALLAALYNRVQVVDLATMEIVWEGRVEDPSHTADTDGETWELGVSGTMVATSDWKIPLWYADAGLDGWIQGDPGSPASVSLDTPADTSLSITLKQGFTWAANNSSGEVWRYNRPGEVGMFIGRFTLTYDGTGSGTEADFDVVTDTELAGGVDVTAFDANGGAPTTKTNIVGDVNSFADSHDYSIYLSVIRQSAAASYTTTRDSPAVRITPVGIQALRVDRAGNRLTNVSDYSHGDFVLVRHVVEDVIGRLMVGTTDFEDITPFPAFATVNPATVYIDATDTTQITTLMYLDGATAADVMNDMMTVQTSAYWAVWESAFGSVHGANGLADTGYRIEWATWPNGWGYLATSQDGLEEQPTADGLYDNVVVKFTNNALTGQPLRSDLAPPRFNSTPPSSDQRPPDLAAGNLSRCTVMDKAQPGNDSDALNAGVAWLGQRDQRLAKNAGALTIKRPILFYDAGANSDRGAARMLDPWMIRPGKLLKLADQIPDGDMTDLSHGTSAVPDTHAGTIYRVVATTYSASDNSCRLELDQPTRWSLATQVTTSGKSANPKVQ
jgi:hypothetical protein